MSRKGSSGMSSSSSGSRPGVFSQEGTQSVRQALGMSAAEAADNYWETLKIPASEKYAQVEGAANSLDNGVLSAKTHVYDVVRTQGAKNNPDLVSDGSWNVYRNDTGRSIREDYMGYLNAHVRTTGGNQVLLDRMSASAKTQLTKAIQTSAQRWLKRNPKPAHPRKDGYKWNGRKYVKS